MEGDQLTNLVILPIVFFMLWGAAMAYKRYRMQQRLQEAGAVPGMSPGMAPGQYPMTGQPMPGQPMPGQPMTPGVPSSPVMVQMLQSGQPSPPMGLVEANAVNLQGPPMATVQPYPSSPSPQTPHSTPPNAFGSPSLQPSAPVYPSAPPMQSDPYHSQPMQYPRSQPTTRSGGGFMGRLFTGPRQVLRDMTPYMVVRPKRCSSTISSIDTKERIEKSSAVILINVR
jgi:hypothetical protein